MNYSYEWFDPPGECGQSKYENSLQLINRALFVRILTINSSGFPSCTIPPIWPTLLSNWYGKHLQVVTLLIWSSRKLLSYAATTHTKQKLSNILAVFIFIVVLFAVREVKIQSTQSLEIITKSFSLRATVNTILERLLYCVKYRCLLKFI